jgi:DNA-binding transcriptional LysR family regulator
MNQPSSSQEIIVELRQLEIFRALAEELHFTRAAARVHCVQSNVTTQIRALEHELGIPLFDRLAKRVVLTDAGRRFLPYAEKVLSTVEEAHAAVSQPASPTGPLRIGAPESVLAYRLPAIISQFRKLYPRVELTFRPYADEWLINSLESGKLDLAVWMRDVVDYEQLTSLHLRAEKVLLIAEPMHELANRERVRPQDLAGQTLLLTEAGCGYRKKLDQLLSLLGIRPSNIIEFSSVEAIKQCASLGMGLGLLPEIVVAEEIKCGQLVALGWVGPQLDIATHVVWHKDKWISPAVHAFISLVKKKLCNSANPSEEDSVKLTSISKRSVGLNRTPQVASMRKH